MNALSDTPISSPFAYVLSFVAIVYLIIYKWRRRKVLKMLKSFYSKPTLPVIGNLHYVTGNAKERVIKLLSLLKEFEFPAVAWLCHIPVVFIGSPSDLQTILHKAQTRDTLGVFKNVLGDSVILSDGSKWRKSRRSIMPAFSTTMLQKYLVVFNERIEVLLKKIHPLANTDTAFDVWNYMVDFNLEVITESMCGHKFELQEKGGNDFRDSLIEVVKMESMRVTQPLLFPDFIYNIYLFLTGKNKLFRKVHEFPRQIISTKIADHRGRKMQQSEIPEETGKGPKTLIDLLLKVHDVDEDFTEEQMRNDLLSMIAAGSETTAITCSFALLMFAMNQDVQEKAYLEIKTICGNSDKAVEMKDINQLVYLEQCIKETLRKFPVIPISFRKYPEDIQLNDKQIIPAGCRIGVIFYAPLHDEQLYPNPEQWDPEHFAPGAVRDHKSGFFAFGAGPRSCIGARYAMVSLKTQLIYLLRNYRFTTDMQMNDIQLTLDMALRNDSGYWLKAWSRHNNNIQ